MTKLSAHGIQMFVAGALAIRGLGSLLSVFYDLIRFKSAVILPVLGASVVSSAALLIGIAMLLGGKHAILWAYVYLWFGLLSSAGMATIYLLIRLHVLRPLLSGSVSWTLSGMVTSAILLWLLAWSRSRRFRVERLA